jgi:CRP-like cAMP-binding protein
VPAVAAPSPRADLPLGLPLVDALVAPTPAASGHAARPREPALEGVELRLNAISQQDGRPVAILNDRLVREGDIFDGIRVVRIGEAEVEVEVDGKRRIVRF